MSLNDPYAAGAARQPRLRVLNNSRPIGGALSFEVHNNAYFSADVFSACFAIYADPDFGLAWWGDEKWDRGNPLIVDIQASLDAGATWTSLLIGQVDHQTVHLDRGLIEVEGRDLASLLIDSHHTPDGSGFLNHTSSQVVETLATRHGLSADVTTTNELVGRFWSDNRTLQTMAYSRSSTEWNLACSLAQHEGFDLWVSGRTLHFHPQTPFDADPYLVVWDKDGPYSNAIDLVVERSLTLARDVTVVVKSWNSQQQRAFSAHSGRSNAPAGNTFSYVFANLIQAECLARAQQIRADLSRHERLISFSRPGDLTLGARDLVRLQGTASSFDQVYLIDSVHRSMSFDGGFVQRVQAKNHPAAGVQGAS